MRCLIRLPFRMLFSFLLLTDTWLTERKSEDRHLLRLSRSCFFPSLVIRKQASSLVNPNASISGVPLRIDSLISFSGFSNLTFPVYGNKFGLRTVLQHAVRLFFVVVVLSENAISSLECIVKLPEHLHAVMESDLLTKVLRCTSLSDR